jgi:hypothetical protein
MIWLISAVMKSSIGMKSQPQVSVYFMTKITFTIRPIMRNIKGKYEID